MHYKLGQKAVDTAWAVGRQRTRSQLKHTIRVKKERVRVKGMLINAV
jgi:hypothetical protein